MQPVNILPLCLFQKSQSNVRRYATSNTNQLCSSSRIRILISQQVIDRKRQFFDLPVFQIAIKKAENLYKYIQLVTLFVKLILVSIKRCEN